jgi:hypothetical protein
MTGLLQKLRDLVMGQAPDNEVARAARELAEATDTQPAMMPPEVPEAHALSLEQLHAIVRTATAAQLTEAGITNGMSNEQVAACLVARRGLSA